MKFFRGMLGGSITGIFAMSIWAHEVKHYNIAGGWFAAFIIISTMWFMNHYIGLIQNDEGAVFIDMATGIAVSGTFRDIFMASSIEPLVDSLPTLVLVILGGTLAGTCAAIIEKDMAEKKAPDIKAVLDEPDIKIVLDETETFNS